MKQFIFQSSITNKSIKEETKNNQKTSKKRKKKKIMRIKDLLN